MNLTKLFETQRVLRNRINYNGGDRLDKLTLASLVEAGECANEHRGFKFWSKNQSPRTRVARGPYMDIEDADFYNPLLEEYVDKFHFILEQGIELGFDKTFIFFDESNVKTHTYDNITVQYIWIFHSTVETWMHRDQDKYEVLFYEFIALGEMLGFTWEEIEQAYYAKNQVNHQRQEAGY